MKERTFDIVFNEGLCDGLKLQAVVRDRLRACLVSIIGRLLPG